MSDALVTFGAISVLSVLWGVVGGYCYAAIAPIEKSVGWSAALVLICGPAAWGLGIYRGLRAGRRAILRRFGVEGYSCCGGHKSSCRHSAS